MKTNLLPTNLIRLLCAALLCTALPSLHAQHRFTRLHSFGATNLAVFAPHALIEGRDGMLYGLECSEAGAVVRLSKDGSNYTVLRLFPGGCPEVLTEGRDGVLYGATRPSDAQGTIFKLNKDGTGYAVLRSFPASADCETPPRVLLGGRDGALYGTTVCGGGANNGTVFKLNTDGTGFTVLRSLTNSAGDGMMPTTLLEGTDDALYGTTYMGGTSNLGTLFRLNKDGTGFTVLHQFIGGCRPEALLEGTDGILYGYTPEQGDRLIFKLNKDGTGFVVLYHVADRDDYVCQLVDGPGGALYWSQATHGDEHSWNGMGLICRLNKDGSGITVLHEFPSTPQDGVHPQGLLYASDGALYGTTFAGGTSDLGTLYKLNPDGTGYQLMRRPQPPVSVPDGSDRLNVIAGRDGMLYGTARQGGSADAGTVFKLSKDGTGFTVLHEFQGAPNDGAEPVGLTEGNDGALYGATRGGGSTNYGAIFKLEKDGLGFVLLRSFLGEPEVGRYPEAPLLEGRDGVLYGTTTGDITDPIGYAQGTLFKLNKDGTGYMVLLHSYGRYDHSALLEGSDGALYGTTYGGDDVDGVFKVNKDGTAYTELHKFPLIDSDSEWRPEGALVEGSDGALYGTTAYSGSAEHYGSVFRLNKDGTGYRLLHRFQGGPDDGAFPYAALVAGGDGALYGTTSQGGRENFGTMFRLNPDGSHYAVLWCFTGSAGDTVSPRQLIEDLDGTLYGDSSWPYNTTLFRLDVAPVLYNPVWSGNVFSFQFNARSNVVYQPQFKSSLAHSNWTALPSITGQRGVVTVTATNLAAAPRFYRVTIP